MLVVIEIKHGFDADGGGLKADGGIVRDEIIACAEDFGGRDVGALVQLQTFCEQMALVRADDEGVVLAVENGAHGREQRLAAAEGP